MEVDAEDETTRKLRAVIGGRHPRSFPNDTPLWIHISDSGLRASKVASGTTLPQAVAQQSPNYRPVKPPSSRFTRMVPQSLCQELEARKEAEREAVVEKSGQPGQAERRPAVASLDSKLVPEEFGFPPSKSPTSRSAEDGAQSALKAKLDGKDDTPLFYGTVVALENLDGGFLTLQHDGGDLKIKPLDARRSDLHGVTSSKMEQSMFTVIDLHDRGNCGPVKDGDHVWLRAVEGCGDPSWRDGSVLGSVVKRVPAVSAVSRNGALDAGGGIAQVVGSVGWVVPVTAFLGTQPDDTVLGPTTRQRPQGQYTRSDPEFDELTGAKNRSALAVGKWRVRRVTPAATSSEAESAPLSSSHPLLLEQDWFYMCGEGPAEDQKVTLRQLPQADSLTDGRRMENMRGQWRMHVISRGPQAGVGRYQQMEALLYRARHQLHQSQRDRSGVTMREDGVPRGEGFATSLRRRTYEADDAMMTVLDEREAFKTHNLDAYFKEQARTLPDSPPDSPKQVRLSRTVSLLTTPQRSGTARSGDRPLSRASRSRPATSSSRGNAPPAGSGAMLARAVSRGALGRMGFRAQWPPPVEGTAAARRALAESWRVPPSPMRAGDTGRYTRRFGALSSPATRSGTFLTDGSAPSTRQGRRPGTAVSRPSSAVASGAPVSRRRRRAGGTARSRGDSQRGLPPSSMPTASAPTLGLPPRGAGARSHTPTDAPAAGHSASAAVLRASGQQRSRPPTSGSAAAGGAASTVASSRGRDGAGGDAGELCPMCHAASSRFHLCEQDSAVQRMLHAGEERKAALVRAMQNGEALGAAAAAEGEEEEEEQGEEEGDQRGSSGSGSGADEGGRTVHMTSPPASHYHARAVELMQQQDRNMLASLSYERKQEHLDQLFGVLFAQQENWKGKRTGGGGEGRRRSSRAPSRASRGAGKHPSVLEMLMS